VGNNRFERKKFEEGFKLEDREGITGFSKGRDLIPGRFSHNLKNPLKEML